MGLCGGAKRTPDGRRHSAYGNLARPENRFAIRRVNSTSPWRNSPKPLAPAPPYPRRVPRALRPRKRPRGDLRAVEKGRRSGD